jgi:hypothetical protein
MKSPARPTVTPAVQSRAIEDGRPDPLVRLPIIIAAVFLAAGNEDFGFDPAGNLDSFMHLGYFWHYPAHLPALDHDYKASRLPWIFPGYVFHWLGDPAAASLVLVFATLAAGGVALYLLVRDITQDRAAAAVSAAAWTSCTWAHGIGGWNYQVLAATDYFLVATWLAFRAATTGAASFAFLAGVCAAAAAHTHLQYATFLPLLAMTFWSGLPDDTPAVQRLVRDGLWALAGAIGMTVALGAVNAASGGDWLFFMPQIVRAQYLMREDVWWLEARGWIPAATYLIVPIAFMIAALPVLFRTHPTERPWPNRTVIVQAWLALGIMCFTQFVRRKGTLDQSFLAFPVYAYGFPCIGILLASRRNMPRSGGVAAASIATILVPLLLLMPATLPRVMRDAVTLFGATGLPPVVPPLAVALIGCAAMMVARGSARLIVFGLWFGLVNAWIAPAPSAYGIHTRGYRRQMLELFREADGVTTAFDPRLDGIKYWFPDNEHVALPGGDIPLAFVFDSYVSTRGWLSNLFGHASAVPLQTLTRDDLHAAVCIALLTSPQTSEQLESSMREHFAALGEPLRRITIRHLKSRNLAFDLTLLKPADAPERRSPPCVRE